VRKVYLPGRVGGSEVGYWEAQWEGVRFSSLLPHIRPSSGPLWALLDEVTEPSHLVLEAGCGSGVVVAYLDGLRRRVVGVDRATGALLSAKRQAPRLELAAGDLTHLPFLSSAFDLVISLGAVEHIEEGAGEALLEHARVLRSGGSMLITVPRLGPVKRWSDFLNLTLRGRTSYRSRGRFVTRVGRPPPKGSSFHQYEYPVDSFRRLLEQAGFEVRWIRPFMVGPGLGESGLVRRLAKRRHRTSAGAPPDTLTDASEHSYPAPPPSAGPGLTGFLREAMLYERGRGPSGAALTRLSQWIFGHMQVALAVKRQAGGPSGS
jgi:SAM-dependent methyltransferase